MSYKIADRLVSFCETMSIEEINKIKSCAKSSNIWDAWFEEKAKVAIIKRACKIHFSGINKNLSKISNFSNQEFDIEQSTPQQQTLQNISDGMSEDIKELQQEQAQKDCNKLIEDLHNVGCVNELQKVWQDNKKTINRLEKYHNDLFQEVFNYKENWRAC